MPLDQEARSSSLAPGPQRALRAGSAEDLAARRLAAVGEDLGEALDAVLLHGAYIGSTQGFPELFPPAWTAAILAGMDPDRSALDVSCADRQRDRQQASRALDVSTITGVASARYLDRRIGCIVRLRERPRSRRAGDRRVRLSGCRREPAAGRSEACRRGRSTRRRVARRRCGAQRGGEAATADAVSPSRSARTCPRVASTSRSSGPPENSTTGDRRRHRPLQGKAERRGARRRLRARLRDEGRQDRPAREQGRPGRLDGRLELIGARRERPGVPSRRATSLLVPMSKDTA